MTGTMAQRVLGMQSSDKDEIEGTQYGSRE
jgi:hypothetical protein